MASSEPRWHPEAFQDAEEARNWYAKRSPLAARGFLGELAVAVAAVSEAPSRWPAGPAGTRRYVFQGRYPFTLVFLLSQDRVEIVAVAHQRKRPEYWLGRL